MDCIHCKYRRTLYATVDLQCYCSRSPLQKKIKAEIIGDLTAPEWCPLKNTELSESTDVDTEQDLQH